MFFSWILIMLPLQFIEDVGLIVVVQCVLLAIFGLVYSILFTDFVLFSKERSSEKKQWEKSPS
jgi:hypothetical protein